MRVAHIGNIAQNAYLNAKFQRRLALASPREYGDVEADSYDQGGGPPMRVPYWEDGDFAPPPEMAEYWFDWSSVPQRNGFVRPPWAKIIGNHFIKKWYASQKAYEADFPRAILYQLTPDLGRDWPIRHVALRKALAEGRLTPDEQQMAFGPMLDEPAWPCVRAIAEQYDLTVLYGPWARYGCTLPRACRWIAFEHSTLRYVPMLRQAGDFLLAAAYQHADHVIVTNADCRRSAETLELERYSWLPHPVDTTTYTPQPDDPAAVRALRRHLEVGDDDVLFFAPARLELHLKGTGTLLYGFLRYLRYAEPAGAPRATLLMVAGGDDQAFVLDLIKTLGLTERVRMMAPQPKCRLRHYYHAADVVLDQFSHEVGSYGTTTGEALACGRPLVTWVDAVLHEGFAACPSSIVCLAKTPVQVGGWLHKLANDPALRVWYGAAGRAWMEEYHDWRRVASESIDLYRRVLASPVPEPREAVAA